MSRRALQPVPRAGLGSPPSSWGRSSTSRAIVCHTKTSVRAASRSAAASSASSSSPASAARSIRRLWEQPPARRLILSTSSPFCVQVEASCFTAATLAPIGPTCSSCWLVRLLVLLSDHAANPATRAGRCNGLTNRSQARIPCNREGARKPRDYQGTFMNCECVRVPSGALVRVVPCSLPVARFLNDPRLAGVFPAICPGGEAGAGLASACWPDQKPVRVVSA